MEGINRWVFITAIAPIAWGSTYYVTREFLPADSPLYGAVIRALPAGLLLLLICRTLPRGEWWWKSVVLGVLNMSAFFALIYLAAQLMPASVASVVMAMSPLALMLAAWGVMGERPRLVAVIGGCLGIAGVAAMVLDGDEAVSPWGVVASLTAMAGSSVGYVLSKKWGRTASVLATTSWQLIAGGLVILPFAVAFEGAPPSLDGTQVAAFAYVSVIATAVAFAAWFGGLAHLRAEQVGLIGLLNPVTGVALGVAVAREHLGPIQIAGVALTLIGLSIGQLRSRRGGPAATRERITSRSLG